MDFLALNSVDLRGSKVRALTPTFVPAGREKLLFIRELPTDIDLDTLSLADGLHRLVIRAEGKNGREGVEEVPFVAHDGAGIIVSGLRPTRYAAARCASRWMPSTPMIRLTRAAPRRARRSRNGCG